MEVKAQFDLQKSQRDSLDKSLRALSDHYERLTGDSLMNGAARTVIRRGRPAAMAAAPKGKRGRRGAKTARLLRIGEQIYDVMHKDKGTKFSTDALRSKLGADTPVGPAVKAWSKANPEKAIAGSGPGRAKQYVLKG